MNAPACSSYDDSLAFVRRYPRSLAALARQHGEEVDDLKQDLHIFFPIWMRQYDEHKGAISTHIFSKLKWRLRGRRRSEFRHVTKGELGDDCRSITTFEVHQDDLSGKPLPLVCQTL